jgi:hypothetical protein
VDSDASVDPLGRLEVIPTKADRATVLLLVTGVPASGVAASPRASPARASSPARNSVVIAGSSSVTSPGCTATDASSSASNAAMTSTQPSSISAVPSSVGPSALTSSVRDPWCAEHALAALPVETSTLVLYLTAHAEALKVSIAQAHRVAGLPTPTTDAGVRSVWRGIRRQVGTA